MKNKKLMKNKKKGLLENWLLSKKQVFVLLVLILFVFSSLIAQTPYRSADSELVTNAGPFKVSLVSSSYLRGNEFLSPFSIKQVESTRHQFRYNENTNTLSFFIQRMGETNSQEKKLYIIINGEVDYVKATRVTSGYVETYIVREFEWIAAPDHSVFNVIPSPIAGMQLMSQAYNLGVSDWREGVDIEVKFKNSLNNDFILGIMAVNPARINRLTEELIQYVFKGLRFIRRSRGDSNYSLYVAFANYHFEHIGAGRKTCNNLVMSGKTYSEKINVDAAVKWELGAGYSIADWNDLKSNRNIDTWISCMGLQSGESFMITVNGNPRFRNGNRQYFVRYAPGGVPSNFAVHDQIGGKLFLGSWYDLNLKILGKQR